MKTKKSMSAEVALFCVGICLVACNRHESSVHSHGGHSHGADGSGGHGHDHPEPHTVQVTLWEGGLEAFVEYRYPVANKNVRFVTHLSDLTSGEPRREGKIVFSLDGPGGGRFEHVEERPARDGVYLPTLVFPVAGVWKAALVVSKKVGESVRFELPDVTVYASDGAAEKAPAPPEPDGISFLKEQQWKLAMLTDVATTRQLSARRSFPAYVRAKAGQRVAVASPVAGRVVPPPEGEFPRRGRVVGAGEILALVEPTIPSAELLSLAVKLAEAEAEELRAAQALKQAQTVAARIERLEKVDAKSARELEQARFDVDAARTALEAATAIKKSYESARAYTESYRSDRGSGSSGLAPIALTAPISGTVIQVGTAPGERVTGAESLFVVLDASTVAIEARIAQHEASGLANPAAYVELGSAATGDVLRRPLTLVYSGLEVEEPSRAVPFVYEVENRDGLLRVGMSVSVFVEVAPPRETLAIPESALVDEDGKYCAFVQLSGERFEKRDLTLGVRDGAFVEVLDGVAPGERVATTDAWTIRLASLATSIPAHGHTH